MSLFLLAQAEPAITAAVSGAGTGDLHQASQPPHWQVLTGAAGLLARQAVLQQDVRSPRAALPGGGDWVRVIVLLGEVGGDQVVVLLALCNSELTG